MVVQVTSELFYCIKFERVNTVPVQFCFLDRHVHAGKFPIDSCRARALPPTDYPDEYQAKAEAHIQRLRQLAIDVVPLQGLHEHLAIIDLNTVWYGSVNVLSRSKENDIIIRLEDSQVARDLSLYLGKLANGSGQEQGLLPLPVL